MKKMIFKLASTGFALVATSAALLITILGTGGIGGF